jgi:lipoprotein signal peptidase
MSTLLRRMRAFVAHDFLRLATLIALAVFLFDWTTKSWALHALRDITMPVGSLMLGIERNDALAFSAARGRFSPAVIMGIRLSAMAAVIYFSRKVVVKSRRFAAGLALVLGGGFGNAADVVFRGGSVVDFIGAGPFSFEWAGERVHLEFVFNIADIAVLLGLALLAPYLRRWALAQQQRLARWESRQWWNREGA